MINCLFFASIQIGHKEVLKSRISAIFVSAIDYFTVNYRRKRKETASRQPYQSSNSFFAHNNVKEIFPRNVPSSKFHAEFESYDHSKVWNVIGGQKLSF